jgi:heterodisulfide reductase subunit B
MKIKLADNKVINIPDDWHVISMAFNPRKDANCIIHEGEVKEFEELKSKAAKWDMIQWAIEKEIPFVDICSRHIGCDTDCISMLDEDIVYLQEFYDKRGAE